MNYKITPLSSNDKKHQVECAPKSASLFRVEAGTLWLADFAFITNAIEWVTLKMNAGDQMIVPNNKGGYTTIPFPTICNTYKE